MSKIKHTQPQVNIKTAEDNSKKSSLYKTVKSFEITHFTHFIFISGSVLLVLLCYGTCLNNLFTDWDDTGYLMSNPLIKDLSFTGFKNIFKTEVMGNYHPLTILSYALEYSVVQFEPWLYHADNLVLHLLVVALVYWLINSLFQNAWLSLICTLLFGLHPLHTETIAWVADRKDLLCSLFFLLGCIVYVYFINTNGFKRIILLTIVFLLFVAALMSKAVAVTFPIILFFIDYLLKRKHSAIMILEKVPFVLSSILFGIITFQIQKGGGAMAVHKISYTILERIELGSYALITYIWKMILPIGFCNLYAYPSKINGSLPFYYMIYSFIVLILVFLLFKFAAKRRDIIFGASFFIVNIALLLQFIPVGDSIMADRYAYLPSIGFTIIAGKTILKFLENQINKLGGKIILVFLLAYLAFYAYSGNQRAKDWYDSGTLWQSELAQDPDHVPVAYNNLGFWYFNQWQATTDFAEKSKYYDSALFLFKKAVALNTDFFNPYQGLGLLYVANRNLDSAKYCFKNALRLQPSAETHGDYANVLLSSGKIDSALSEYNLAISFHPVNNIPYIARGRIYYHTDKWEDAENDFTTALKIDSTSGEAYYEQSICFAHKNDYRQAIVYINKARRFGYGRIDTNYYNNVVLALKSIK